MIVVLADDITGAAEIAGVCLRYGLTVSFAIDTLHTHPADVVIYATDSRSLTEQEAAVVHEKFAITIAALHPEWIFKKCDSVLRGFVLPELKVLAKAVDATRVLLQPANPLTKRCIRNGVYYIGAHRIEHTGFASDPDFPAGISDVAGLLTLRAPSCKAHVVVAGDDSFILDGISIHIPDCNSALDMQGQIASHATDSLWVGSAAFFEELIKYKGIGHPVRINIPTQHPVNDFLLVAGTAHPESLIFAQKLQHMGCPVCHFPDALLSEHVTHDQLSEWAHNLIRLWNQHTMLSVGIATQPVSFPGSKAALKNRLSTVAEMLIETRKPGTILIEGGATAYHLLKHMGCNSLIPLAELGPGVLKLKDSLSSRLFIIKPGSYSWPDNIVNQSAKSEK